MKKIMWIFTLLLLILSITGCSTKDESEDKQMLISKEEAVKIAKEMSFQDDAKASWNVEFKEDFQADPDNESDKKCSVWMVSATYSAGNQTIFYIDALTKEALSVADIEAPHK